VPDHHQTPKSDLELILHALEFAAHKHRDQRRKDVHASPYINHPIALANILVNEADIHDPEVICAALLHDTIEDTETTAEELAAEFGAVIRDIVLEVTDDQLLQKAERKRLQIEHAAHASPKAKLVKLADKISNLRDIASSPPANWSLARQQEYFDWAKAVIDRVRGANAKLEAAFDRAYARRPSA
jgi:GTP diphosphokinase / guanosine-3',5'-bis(diphosphate) 3'-diphosphatase